MILFLIILLSSQLINLLTNLFDDFISVDNPFILLFTVLFLLNFFLFRRIEKFNFNLDIIIRYLIFFLKTPSILVNFLLNMLKQIYIFMFRFKYQLFISTFLIVLNSYLKKLTLIWRPLFKKFSYFGYFRSQRSKWIK